MTTDLTPAQAARLDEAARVLAEIHNVRGWDEAEDVLAAALAEAEQRGYERGRRDFQFNPSGDNHHNAALCPYCSPVAAIDVMRGAADDGAVGRVLALETALRDLIDHVDDQCDPWTGTCTCPIGRARAAVGAPATAEEDDR